MRCRVAYDLLSSTIRSKNKRDVQCINMEKKSSFDLVVVIFLCCKNSAQKKKRISRRQISLVDSCLLLSLVSAVSISDARFRFLSSSSS